MKHKLTPLLSIVNIMPKTDKETDCETQKSQPALTDGKLPKLLASFADCWISSL